VKILRWELADMWGHISCRSPRGDSFLIMPIRPPYDHSLAEDELLQYDMEGNLLSGRRDPPAEIFFFTALLRRRRMSGR
jgi:ribulose-5-phosphate 4-epimerase/fuculose-1-phosphate aldolase